MAAPNGWKWCAALALGLLLALSAAGCESVEDKICRRMAEATPDNPIPEWTENECPKAFAVNLDQCVNRDEVARCYLASPPKLDLPQPSERPDLGCWERCTFTAEAQACRSAVSTCHDMCSDDSCRYACNEAARRCAGMP